MRFAIRLLCVVVVSALCYRGAPPARAADADAGKDVVVATKDGMKLAATFWAGPTPGGAGVVLLHMYKSDRTAWSPLVPHLRARGLAVLAIDLRGHGGSAKQGSFSNLAQRVDKRDPKLFADMHQDAIAAVRFLAKDGKCDAKRIALVGASVGCSIALDAARRYPGETAAVLCMSPGANYMDLNSLEHAKTFAADEPLLLLVHKSEADKGASALHDAVPKSRIVVYEDAAPADAAKDDLWAHGTKMFGRLPLVEQTVASFVAARTRSKQDDVVLDGALDGEDAAGGPWTHATLLESGALRGWAYRVGRRVQFGGRVKGASTGVSVALTTFYAPGTAPGVFVSRDGKDYGNPEAAAIDLAKGSFAWVEPFDSAHGAKSYGHRTRPVVRVVKTPDGFTFEGEWYSDYGEDKSGASVDPVRVGFALAAEEKVPAAPEKIAPGAVAIPLSDTTDVEAR